MARIALLVIGLSVLTIHVDAQPSAAVLWKARALEAANALAVLQGKIGEDCSQPMEFKDAMQVRCEVMLESAYAAHITMEDVAHKTDGDTDFFRLVLSGGERARPVRPRVRVHAWESFSRRGSISCQRDGGYSSSVGARSSCFSPRGASSISTSASRFGQVPDRPRGAALTPEAWFRRIDRWVAYAYSVVAEEGSPVARNLAPASTRRARYRLRPWATRYAVRTT